MNPVKNLINILKESYYEQGHDEATANKMVCNYIASLLCNLSDTNKSVEYAVKRRIDTIKAQKRRSELG